MRYVEYAGAYVCVGCGIQLLAQRPEGVDYNTAIAKLIHPVNARTKDSAGRLTATALCPYNGTEGIITLEVKTAV